MIHFLSFIVKPMTYPNFDFKLVSLLISSFTRTDYR